MMAGGDVQGCREGATFYNDGVNTLFYENEGEACVEQLERETGEDYYLDCTEVNVSDGMPPMVFVEYCKVKKR